MIFLDKMGHLYSDESWQELYDFAVKKLKLKSNWNHYSRNFLHFDLTTAGKRNQALALGAKREEDELDVSALLMRTKTMNINSLEKNRHLEFWFPCRGLYGQKILRVDFALLGII